MEKDWSLRRVVAADAEQVAAHGQWNESPGSQRRLAYADWVRPRIEAGSYIGWFAMHGQIVVAGAGAILLDWGPTRANPGGIMARINNVFTDVNWRRRGIARAVVNSVLECCESRGVQEFNLGATAEARALYVGFGFEDYLAEMRRRVAPRAY
jgi:GNAT superfamily N-acetyltransferase